MMFPFPTSVAKIRKAIENALKEAVAIPMNKRHRTDALRPLCPIRIVD
jgi:hypothetical protein